MNSPTEISITIDTEFSIAGAFAEGKNYQPVSDEAVLCQVDGKEQGLGFLLETFEKYNIAASFFIETANHYFFGDEPMQNIARRIIAAGQDVQLHVHPVWLSFIKNPEIGIFPRQDSCSGLSYDDLKKIFELCLAVFHRWTDKMPEAIRTGSLKADMNIYKVMADLQIPLASNIGLGVFRPAEQELQVFSGQRSFQGVLELPVFSYQDMNFMGRKHIKSLQITSCSWPEMKYILTQARRQGIQNIVILTHPFEYIKKADIHYNHLIRNRINQNRLKQLCKFISKHDQDFVSSDFSQLASRIKTCNNTYDPLLKIPSYYAIGRKINNKINDMIWSY